MQPRFHLSIGVPSLDESIAFFTDLLGGTIAHRDPSGYVNVDLFGTELTLKTSRDAIAGDLHFGLNFARDEFDRIAARILASGYAGVVAAPRVVDAGTSIERKKMYLRCPAGYLIELKGY
ncbi:MAG TPA: VOC family protein [Thermoanaerobaculia bacterium]|nr:VOC family protein [Thermoanaerobaculia bacterium]